MFPLLVYAPVPDEIFGLILTPQRYGFMFTAWFFEGVENTFFAYIPPTLKR